MRFVLMPAGTFLMGSPEDEPGRDQDETQHRVTITKPYYMQMTEVTNDQYFGYARPVEGKRWVEPPSVFGLAQPVVHVSQLDAQAFARWVTLLDSHRTYRLPTEAEWEYACRAGTTTAFAFGDRLRADQANVETDAGGKRAEKRVPKPVGSFPPNAWGLYDMHGNVMEWCEGALSEYPAAAVTDPPPVPGEGGYVGILRGGSYGGPARDARSAARYGSRHDMPFWWTVGFRLVAPLPDAD
jgi:formylglycine-generating enzyme required for sulfatase activity